MHSVIHWCGRIALMPAGIVVALLCAPAPAGATVVLEQPPTLDGSGVTSDTAVRRVFEDFVLPADATVNHVRWYGGVTTLPGIYEPLNGPLTFTIGFFETSGTSSFQPADTPLFEFVVSATNNPTAVAFVAEFEAFLPDAIDLPGGDRLWISIMGHDLGAGPCDPFTCSPFGWGSTNAVAPGALGLSTSLAVGSSSYTLHVTNHAFALELLPRNVPEPGLLGLFGVGLAGLALGRRNRSD